MAEPDARRPPWQLAVAVLPLILAWLASPAIAHALGAPGASAASTGCPRESRRQALRYALLHWRFFDRFVTAETHWLAPDNFQEDPEPVVAMRTSPTNIGLQLLATVERLGPGLHHARRDDPAAGAGLPLAGADAALPRALLQLVRPATT